MENNMSNAVEVENIREALYVAELTHDTENKIQESNRQMTKKMEIKYAKIIFLCVAPILTILFSIIGIIFSEEITSGIFGTIIMGFFVAMAISFFVLFCAYAKISMKYGYEGMFDTIERSIHYSHTVRKLRLQLLEAEHDVELIRVNEEKSNALWKNVLLKKDDKVREYYVSFPKDDNGYTFSECYEFIPRSKP